jgi:hypothetical protein
MKTETDYTGEFMNYVKGMPRPWTVLKHSDRFTKGIPDLSISNTSSITVWIEAKRIDNINGNIRNAHHWISKADVLQLNMVARLNGWYLIYDPAHSQTGFIRATTAYRHYRQELLIEKLDEPEFLLSGERAFAWQKVYNYLEGEL